MFLGLFAFDTLEEPGSLGEKLGALALHLFPTWLCLFGVAIAWRREWIGGVTFAALALAYAVWAHAHPDWILVVGGPLLLVAVLHLLAWNRRRANAAH